uniref:Retrovirus-related Pol polyprotein from transposon TNT 1-94 n=1 Tax=Cajanus cajan TaxID=3821 RepID=A0A151SX75_CAJCA|nr:Retrovirus-related Pol polyprotein from transposon TNT 1-94 [Cajanus cajan]
MIKLDFINYSIWKSQMEDLLFCRDLYDPIEANDIKPKDKSEEDWKKVNRKTISMIRQWIDQSICHHVSNETNTFNLWKKLSELFESKNAQNKAFLIQKLVNLKYKDGSSVAEHLSNFQNLVN